MFFRPPSVPKPQRKGKTAAPEGAAKPLGKTAKSKAGAVRRLPIQYARRPRAARSSPRPKAKRTRRPKPKGNRRPSPRRKPSPSRRRKVSREPHGRRQGFRPHAGSERRRPRKATRRQEAHLQVLRG